jgi:hypothetical protein
MAGLVPAIHVFLAVRVRQDVDARDKPGHDEVRAAVAARKPPLLYGGLMSKPKAL